MLFHKIVFVSLLCLHRLHGRMWRCGYTNSLMWCIWDCIMMLVLQVIPDQVFTNITPIISFPSANSNKYVLHFKWKYVDMKIGIIENVGLTKTMFKCRVKFQHFLRNAADLIRNCSLWHYSCRVAILQVNISIIVV